MNEFDAHTGPDPRLDRLGEQLQAVRPELSALELDRIKQRALARTRSQPVRRPTLRIAALASLLAGTLAVGAGASVGVIALGGDGSAPNDQYAVLPTSTTSTTTLPAEPKPPDRGENGDGSQGTFKPPTQGSGGATLGGGPGGDDGQAPPSEPAQAAEQLATEGGSLAFTGYLAIPLLAVGLLLTAAGVVLLRRPRHGES